MEIGFGSGLNMPAYPPEVHLVYAVEPALTARRLAEERIAESHVRVEHVALRGESIPLEDNSCDGALSTFTLCTIPDVGAALAEVRRVLRPGGRFHFLEHGLSPDPSVANWQRRLDPLQKRLADGCHLTRDTPTPLRAAGFESYPAMTMAGSRIDRIPADQFNHSVAAVKLSTGEWMLLDPTWIPGVREMWSSAEQQQEFLLGIPGGADVMSTPVSPAENHYWKAVNHATLAEDGSLEGTVTIEAEGQSDSMLRRAFARSHRSSWEDQFTTLFLRKFPQATVGVSAMTRIEDLSVPFSITLTYRIPAYATIDGKKVLLRSLLLDTPFDDSFNAAELGIATALEKRDYGFRTRCSKLVRLDETITLPASLRAERLPDRVQHIAAPASFIAAVTMEGNALSISAEHRLEKRLYEAAEWPAFRAALLARKELSSTPIILSR